MIGIITGDIVQSRKASAAIWMPYLKQALNQYGTEPRQWEIYRGDSFQLEVPVVKGMQALLAIKAGIKQVKGMDVRMALGIGDKSYAAQKITESNGTAFTNSGICFEQLKKRTVSIRTPWDDLNDTMNTMLGLASLVMDQWTPISSKILTIKLEQPTLRQRELARMLNISQSNISAGLRRAGYDEIKKMMTYYEAKIQGI